MLLFCLVKFNAVCVIALAVYWQTDGWSNDPKLLRDFVVQAGILRFDKWIYKSCKWRDTVLFTTYTESSPQDHYVEVVIHVFSTLTAF